MTLDDRVIRHGAALGADPTGVSVSVLRAARHQPARAASELLVRLADHPALLSAPHAEPCVRDGKVKAADLNTAGLVLEAARRAGARAVAAAAPLADDPNFDPDTAFRRQVAYMLDAAPGFLLDVHGMRDSHGPDVVVGTSGGRTPDDLLARVVTALFRCGLTYDVRAEGALSAEPLTMTSWALSRGTPAVQLEFARRLRSPRDDPSRFALAVEALAEVAGWSGWDGRATDGAHGGRCCG